MSTRKRKNKAPLPASNAGLLRLFEDDMPSFRTNLDIMIGARVALQIGSLLVLAFLKQTKD